MIEATSNEKQQQDSQGPKSDEHGPKPDEGGLTIVGVGASAGGLGALKSFFGALPPDPRAAFVVVVHMSPEYESHLARILQSHCSIPVQQVNETVLLEPNQVYVIPPNANLDAIDTHLRLAELEKAPKERATINHFFESLAQTHSGRAIAVVLTGTGTDGTLGLRRVKERGGLTIVQDPDEAEYDGMPRSAVGSGMVDMILPVKEIPAEIVRFARTRPRVALPADGEEMDGDGDRILQKIFAQIRTRTGHDFSSYKRSTVMRRIYRRMQLRHVESLSDYLEVVRRDRHEATELFNDLLITVTQFFRDKDVFERLEKQVIPTLFNGKSKESRVRVWSVGCSTGEEAYSLAMLLLEESSRREVHTQVQVFASDLHEKSLNRAREGIYPREIAAEVSASRLKRFFTEEQDHYRVRREVRETVVFATHDVLRDPPFAQVDLIVCRNLLIYLQRDVQRDVLTMFHYALAADGLLFLGTSETVAGTEMFVCEDKHACIYRKQNVPTQGPRLPVFPVSPGPRQVRDSVRAPRSSERTSFGAIHERVVERYAPPSVLVNPDHEVVHSSARAGAFLKVPGGEPTKNLFKLVLEPLRMELRTLLHAARESREPGHSRPIEVEVEGKVQAVVLRVHPVPEQELAGYQLVIFDEPLERPAPASGEAGQGGATRPDLEAEVELYKHRLQSAVEQYETSREEMQGANEELQSANEELRSTMEELETSKEELQSMNEELAALNQENRNRVEELSQLSGDLSNLLASTEIATLFLDRQLRIVRYTQGVSKLFNIRLTDRGRPLGDVTRRLSYPELEQDARQVLSRLTPVEREVFDADQHYFMTRVLPYRTAEDRIEGVVITFVDISDRKRAEEEIRRSEERYRSLFNSMDEGFCVVELIFDESDQPVDFKFLEVNPAFERQAGIPNPVGRRAREVVPELGPEWLERYAETLRTGKTARFQKSVKSLKREYDVCAFPAREKNALGIVFTDITERKMHEERLRTVVSELNHRVKNTLATIQAVSQQTAMTATSVQDFDERFSTRLRSIAAAHGLLTRNDWEGAELHEILRAELEARVPSDEHLQLDGPRVRLESHAVLPVHLAIHELATNACKYGALSVPEGRLKVGWTLRGKGDRERLHLEWKEVDGPPVASPDEKGYGSRLLRGVVTSELDGAFEHLFEPDGLRCRISFPLNRVGKAVPEGAPAPPGVTKAAVKGAAEKAGQASPSAAAADKPAKAGAEGPEQAGRPVRVLVVEDTMVIARLLCTELERVGCQIVGPVPTLERATKLSRESEFDAALLDVNLRGEEVFPLARELADRKIPFAILTGYAPEELPPDLEGSPVFTKPIETERLFAWLERYAGLVR